MFTTGFNLTSSTRVYLTLTVQVLEHSIYWYYLINSEEREKMKTFLSIPFIGIIWSFGLEMLPKHQFLSIPFIGIIWSCIKNTRGMRCSWAFHLLVLFDLTTVNKHTNTRSWAFHLLVLFDPQDFGNNQREVLEHSIYWYYLIDECNME